MPKASVLYDLPSDLGNVYATVTKGYKSGGFNTQMFSEIPSTETHAYHGNREAI